MEPAKVYDWFAIRAALTPRHPALKCHASGDVISYALLNEYGENLTDWLKNAGLRKGDRLAVIAENSILLVALLAVAQKSGIILVPLNYRLTPAELNEQLSISRPAAVIVDNKFADRVPASQKDINNKPQWTTELLTTAMKSHTRSEYSDQEANPEDTLPAESFFSESRPQKVNPDLFPDPDHPAMIIFTSGSTGRPKGAVYTHGMMHWNSINTQMRLGLTGHDRTVHCAPPYHTGGWNVLLTPFLHQGAFTVIMKTFDAEVVLTMLREEKATIWWGVPTMLGKIAALPSFREADLSRLRCVAAGGEPMPVPLIDKWAAKGIAVRQGYGLTEAGPNVTSLDAEYAMVKKGSIGTPNFYFEVRLSNERDEECRNGEPGELWLAGPAVFPGYYGDKPATQAAFEGKWLKTGDVAVRDEEGFLFLVDRKKNMYISGGENVYPAEVEKLLLRIDGIEEAAVVAVKDEQWGEAGRAFVVANNKISQNGQLVIREARKLMAAYKVPGEVIFLAELPRMENGKVDRIALKNYIHAD